MVGWHHWLNRHEFEQTPGDYEGPGSLACCCLWDHKESDMTELLNNNKMLSNTRKFRVERDSSPNGLQLIRLMFTSCIRYLTK